MGLEDTMGERSDAGDDRTPGDLDLARRLLELNLQRADGHLSEEEFAGQVTELLAS
jgi:hypothetical protein